MQTLPFKDIFRTPCDLSQAAAEDCAKELGPAFIYTLTVGPQSRIYAQQLIKALNAEVLNNPFAPTINLVIDEKLIGCAWYFSVNDQTVGSRGY